MTKFVKPLPDDIALGLRIKNARVAGGFSMRGFAQKAGLNLAKLIEWEFGRVRVPQSRVQEIADFLHIDFLLLRDGPEKWKQTLASVVAPVDPNAVKTASYEDAMAGASQPSEGAPAIVLAPAPVRRRIFHKKPVGPPKLLLPAKIKRRPKRIDKRGTPAKPSALEQAALDQWVQMMLRPPNLTGGGRPESDDDDNDNFRQALMRGLRLSRDGA